MGNREDDSEGAKLWKAGMTSKMREIELNKIVKAAKMHLGSNTPSKDKFLGYYRYCQFNVEDSIHDSEDFKERFKDKPLNDENYRKYEKAVCL